MKFLHLLTLPSQQNSQYRLSKNIQILNHKKIDTDKEIS